MSTSVRAALVLAVLAMLALSGHTAPVEYGVTRELVGGSGAQGAAEVFEGEEGDGYFITEKSSFTYLKLEQTDSYALGYLHGTLLFQKVERALEAYGYLTDYRYGLGWNAVRRHAVTFWPNVPGDYRLEVEGIADGAADMGCRRPESTATVDWVDILALNAMWDIWWRIDQFDNLPGLWPFAPDGWDGSLGLIPGPIHHCSAFVAAGDATLNGEIIMVQSLWMPYYLSPAHAVFLDFTPPDGNRILMEVTAGMIWSGTEWYINSAGLMVAETTLGVAPYNWGEVPAFVRIRKAVQYATSIDEFRDIMLTDTNGAYCGDYLLGDTKTGEAAILELGCDEWELARTKNGFLQSCNYPWDPEVAAEMGATQGWDHSCYPRYVRWEQLRDANYGNITEDHAKLWIGDHYDTVEEKVNPCSWTLCGHVENASGYPHGSLDAKVGTSSMVARMECWARFGHSCGRDFDAADHAAKNPDYAFPNLRDMPADDWKTFSAFSEVEVAVVDGDGRPVAGAEVSFCSRIDGTLHVAAAGSDGVASFPYLPNSDYHLNASKGKLAASRVQVVSGPGRLEITIEEDGGGGLSEQMQSVLMGALVLVLLAVPALIYLRRRKGAVAK